MDQHTEQQGAVEALASLTDPTRRALFEYVQDQGQPVGRDEAAFAAGISRSLAAYHLDRLVESGLLRTRFARPEGRTGPGAGRPSKLYEPSREAVEVSVPRRNYRLAARVFAEALAADPTEKSQDALRTAARGLGRAMLREASPDPDVDLLDALRALGYQPYVEGETVCLRNCLFADLTRDQRELTCSMNLGLIEGALEAMGDGDREARLDPQDGRCCVAILRQHARQA